MFVSQEHHPQLLERESYHAPQQWDRERAHLFQDAWHCVGLISDLPREGAFRTMRVLDRPLILWRKDGEVHALLNVCSHRYARLTRADRGACERLRCQYHGWEYDTAGNVRSIPDARTFRPLQAGMVGLRRYATAMCGQLVFVNFADDPVPLRDALGSAYDTYAEWFGPEMRTAISLNRVIDANWKVLVENALESYHTTEVHPKTFGPSPREEDCRHEIAENWTSLVVSYEGEKSFRQALDRFGHWMVGAKPHFQYEHRIHYPHLMFSRLSIYRWIECILPLSPSQSMSVTRVVCHAGRGPLRPWNAFWARRWAGSFLMRVGSEDAAVLPQVQEGLESIEAPPGGLISTREERIFHFQQYVEHATRRTRWLDSRTAG